MVRRNFFPPQEKKAPRAHLETLKQREQQRVVSDLVNPGRLFAHHVAQEVKGRQTTCRLGHALVHLVKKVLQKRQEMND